MSQVDPQNLPELWGRDYDRIGGDFASAFDLPGVLADNALRGRLFAAGLNPATMAPEDRASLADRIKEEAGGHPLSNAIIEVAMNPWVWLGVAFSGAFKLPPVGRMFDPADDALATIRSNGFLLEKLGLSTTNATFAGTDMAPILGFMDDTRRAVWAEASGIQASRDRVLNTIRRAHIADDPKLDAAIQAKLHGMDRTWVEKRAVARGSGADVSVEVQEITREAVFDGARLDAYLASKGATGYVEDLRGYYRDQWQRLFGKAGQPDVVDPDKVARLYRSQRTGISGVRDEFNDGAVSALFGEDVAAAMRDGALSREQFAAMVSDAFERNEFYAPMQRTHSYYKGAGMPPVRHDDSSVPRSILRRVRDARRPTRSPMAEQRVVEGRMFDPEDLRLLREFRAGRGPDSKFEEIFKRSRDELERLQAATEDGVYGLASLRSDAALNRYTTQAARVYAGHIAEVPRGVWREVEKARARTREAALNLRRRAENGDEKARKLLGGLESRKGRARWETGEDAFEMPSGTPLGGWTAMDLARGSYAITANQHARSQIRDVILPVIEGRRSLREGVFTGLLNHTKEAAAGFFGPGTFLADQMDAAGLGNLRKGLVEWGESPLRSPVGADRALANFFYASTLGVNLGTVALNMTQPMVTTVRVVEPQHIIAAYGDAMAGMARYARLRTNHLSAHGLTRRGLLLGVENGAEKRRMVQEAFGEMADLTEIGPHMDEIVENLEAPAIRRWRGGLGGKIDDVEQFVLKGFEKGEWMNRLVTGHAVRRRAAAQGVTNADDIARDVRQTVERTQFSAETLNTSPVFLDDNGPLAGALTNPAFRQFLTFPSRMVMSVPEGFRRGQGVEAFNDFARAMASGAIMFEVGKELFGADLSPATITGATLGVMRDSGVGAPFPVPPAVQLPTSIGMALLEQDTEQVRYTLPLLMPGGVAISRALGIAPEVPILNRIPIQRTTVDWNNPTEDGRYGVYNREGRLISFESLPSLLARAAGLDFGRFQQEGEMIRYLSNIREQTIEQERRYLMARMSGQHERARSIAREYEQRYGLRMEISSAQVDAFRNSRVVSRIERMMQSLPSEIREKASPIVAQSLGDRLGVPPDAFARMGTVVERDPYRRAAMSQSFRQELDAMVAERRARDEGSFQPFTPFGSR